MCCDSPNEDNSIANGYTPPLPFTPDRAASVSMPAANNAPPA